MKRVLITGARSPAALDIARDFAAAGYQVHMADSSPARISRWSTCVTRFHNLKPPVQNRMGFWSDMVRLVAELKPQLVVPTCEEIFHLADGFDEGLPIGPLFAPPMKVLDQLHAKDRFASLARSLGLHVPQTRLLTSREDLAKVDLQTSVIKACYSRFGCNTYVRPTAQQIEHVRPTPKQPWIEQEFRAGQEHSSYAIAIKGEITLFAAYRSTMTLAGGAGYAFKPAPPEVTARMLEASRRIARELKITGQISLDAIDDGRNTWLIECNPRATSGVHLLSGAGQIAAAMTGESCSTPTATACHNLPMMLSYGMVSPLAMLKELFSGRDIISRKGDRRPILGALMDTWSFAKVARKHGTTLTGATTIDTEWNGQR